MGKVRDSLSKYDRSFGKRKQIHQRYDLLVFLSLSGSEPFSSKHRKSNVSFTWILASVLPRAEKTQVVGRGKLPDNLLCVELDRMPLAAEEASTQRSWEQQSWLWEPRGVPATWAESWSTFTCLDLGLCVRSRVNGPVAHSTLARDLNKNKLQVLTVIDGLLLHLCRVFLL